MEWNGKGNGTVNVYTNFKVELATMCLGLLSHCRVYTCKSSGPSILPCLVSDVTVRTRAPQRLATVSCTYYWKAATKVLIPRSDQGLRCTDEDQSEVTED